MLHKSADDKVGWPINWEGLKNNIPKERTKKAGQFITCRRIFHVTPCYLTTVTNMFRLLSVFYGITYFIWCSCSPIVGFRTSTQPTWLPGFKWNARMKKRILCDGNRGISAVGFCAGTVSAAKAKKAKKIPRGAFIRGILSGLNILKWCCDYAVKPFYLSACG